MSYAFFLLMCIAIHSIINFDLFRKKQTVNIPGMKSYRTFVVSVFALFIVDFLWGIFEQYKIATALRIDTFIYYIVMGFSILAWARYTVKYVEGKGIFARITLIFGNLFFLTEIILLIVNFFTPLLFSVDSNAVFIVYKARYIMLYIQILLFLLLFVYTGLRMFGVKGSLRRRYLTIALYSIILSICLSIQVYFPNLPLYTVGCIVGGVLLSSYFINGIKDDYKAELEKSRNEVIQGKIELNEAKVIAYSDPLTNVKNKHAYVEEEDRIDKLINKGEMEDFAAVVFDLNGLKIINDTKGHDAGDQYIIDSCKVIEKYFGHDHLYRFGGDEFVVILTGEMYKNRSKILIDFEQYIDDCLSTDKPIISSGMSRYKRGEDNTYHAVFYRADKIMYTRKDVLKQRQSFQAK